MEAKPGRDRTVRIAFVGINPVMESADLFAGEREVAMRNDRGPDDLGPGADGGGGQHARGQHTRAPRHAASFPAFRHVCFDGFAPLPLHASLSRDAL